MVARRKVGQALRENNTEEARAAKRAKYQGRLNSKKKAVAATATAGGDSSSTVPIVVSSGNEGIKAAPMDSQGGILPIDATENTNAVAV